MRMKRKRIFRQTSAEPLIFLDFHPARSCAARPSLRKQTFNPLRNVPASPDPKSDLDGHDGDAMPKSGQVKFGIGGDTCRRQKCRRLPPIKKSFGNPKITVGIYYIRFHACRSIRAKYSLDNVTRDVTSIMRHCL